MVRVIKFSCFFGGFNCKGGGSYERNEAKDDRVNKFHILVRRKKSNANHLGDALKRVTEKHGFSLHILPSFGLPHKDKNGSAATVFQSGRPSSIKSEFL